MNHDSDLTAEEYAAARAYALVIEWSDEDQVYVATAPDIRGCRTHGATRADAARMGEEAIALVLAALTSRGQTLPPARFTAVASEVVASATSWELADPRIR